MIKHFELINIQFSTKLSVIFLLRLMFISISTQQADTRWSASNLYFKTEKYNSVIGCVQRGPYLVSHVDDAHRRTKMFILHSAHCSVTRPWDTPLTGQGQSLQGTAHSLTTICCTRAVTVGNVVSAATAC